MKLRETIYGWESKGLHAAGNAIVPQVAYNIFQAIRQYEHNERLQLSI